LLYKENKTKANDWTDIFLASAAIQFVFFLALGFSTLLFWLELFTTSSVTGIMAGISALIASYKIVKSIK
jgi:hypothetical protein